MSRIRGAAVLLFCLAGSGAPAAPSRFPVATAPVSVPGPAAPIRPASVPMPAELPSDPFTPAIPGQRFHKFTATGATIMPMSVVGFDRECRSTGPVPVRVVVPARHGEIPFKPGRAPAGARRNVLGANCQGVELPGTFVYYRSTPGYVGPDTVTLHSCTADGTVETAHFDISVE